MEEKGGYSHEIEKNICSIDVNDYTDKWGITKHRSFCMDLFTWLPQTFAPFP